MSFDIFGATPYSDREDSVSTPMSRRKPAEFIDTYIDRREDSVVVKFVDNGLCKTKTWFVYSEEEINNVIIPINVREGVEKVRQDITRYWDRFNKDRDESLKSLDKIKTELGIEYLTITNLDTKVAFRLSSAFENTPLHITVTNFNEEEFKILLSKKENLITEIKNYTSEEEVEIYKTLLTDLSANLDKYSYLFEDDEVYFYPENE